MSDFPVTFISPLHCVVLQLCGIAELMQVPLSILHTLTNFNSVHTDN